MGDRGFGSASLHRRVMLAQTAAMLGVSALMLWNGSTAIDGTSGTGYRDGLADCCAIARLSELNRPGAWFLTPVSRVRRHLLGSL
jgi:hypothetical protein